MRPPLRALDFSHPRRRGPHSLSGVGIIQGCLSTQVGAHLPRVAGRAALDGPSRRAGRAVPASLCSCSQMRAPRTQDAAREAPFSAPRRFGFQ